MIIQCENDRGLFAFPLLIFALRITVIPLSRYRDITCIMNARILNLPLYRTGGGGGTEFLTPYADPYNELGLYRLYL